MKLIFSLAITFLFTLTEMVSAQELAKKENFSKEFGFQSDNDAYLFYGQDQYYTNGLFITYSQAFNSKKLHSRLDNKIWSVSISQKMYNPKSGYAPISANHDRPFAASLFASYGQTNFYKNNSVIKIGGDLGFVGPRALGQEAQELLHSTVGFYDISGWDYQIGNAFLAQLNFAYFKPLGANKSGKIDWNFGSKINAGTIHNNVNLNLIFRAGIFKPFAQSIISGGHLNNKSNSNTEKQNESFFYLKPNISLVLNDATLQGNLFKENSPITFNPKPLVLSTQIGYQFNIKRFRFDYHLLFNTKEVKSKALPHQYGSISIHYLFN